MWELKYEQCGKLSDPRAPVQRFFKESEWRRELSRIWQEDNPDWDREWKNQDEQVRKTLEIQAHEGTQEIVSQRKAVSQRKSESIKEVENLVGGSDGHSSTDPITAV
jgi:hypothetical protein